jgi:S1-C subfamily serine protease
MLPGGHSLVSRRPAPGRRPQGRLPAHVEHVAVEPGILDGAPAVRIEAAQVLPGSPAEKAGLRPGDRVLAIAGRAVGEYTVDSAADVLDRGPPGRKVKLEIERDGKKKRVKIRLPTFVSAAATSRPSQTSQLH